MHCTVGRGGGGCQPAPGHRHPAPGRGLHLHRGHRPPGSQAQAEEGGQTQVSCDWLGAGHVTSVLSPDWSIVQAQERDQGEDLRGDLGGWRQVSGVSGRVLGRKI